MSDPRFWNSLHDAKEKTQELGLLKSELATFISVQHHFQEVKLFNEMLETEYDFEITLLFKEELTLLLAKLLQLEDTLHYAQPYDHHCAIIEISSGAGGTESQDFAYKLFGMYVRFLDKQKMKYDITYFQSATDAGIKSATITVNEANSFGLLRNEKGVHRLSRVSPYDASGRRHTSFASVNVLPLLDHNIHIEIRDDDLHVDVFRSSGAGGQHVNVTDSAVRMTHKPTGIIVGCQSERSQIMNRQKALKMLYAKLFEREILIKEAEMVSIQGTKKTAGFGNHIRSYVLNPYSLVKDHRSGFSTNQADFILEGNLMDLIRSNM